MILFYNKKNGNVFATIDGRVHDKKQLGCYVCDSNNKKEEIGKFIIGWLEGKDGNRVEYNLDKIKLLEKFEDITTESPLEYKIDLKKGTLIKK